MDRFLIRKSKSNIESSSSSSTLPQLIDLEKLPRDPSKRKRMVDYYPNQHEEIRRK